MTIETNDKYSDREQASAAGFLEGVLTAGFFWISIPFFLPNLLLADLLSILQKDSVLKWESYGMSGPPKEVTDFLVTQWNWMKGLTGPTRHGYTLIADQVVLEN